MAHTIIKGETQQIGVEVANFGNVTAPFYLIVESISPSGQHVQLLNQSLNYAPGQGQSIGAGSVTFNQTGTWMIFAGLYDNPIKTGARYYEATSDPILVKNPPAPAAIFYGWNISYSSGKLIGGCTIKNIGEVRETFYIGFSAMPNIYNEQWEHTTTPIGQLTVTLNPGQVSSALYAYITPKYPAVTYSCTMTVRAQTTGDELQRVNRDITVP